MNKLVQLFVLLMGLNCLQLRVCFQSSPENNKFYKKPLLNLIVNGIDAPSPRPFFAKIVVRDYFCGATIISSVFAITAAHCVFAQPGESTLFSTLF